MDTLVKLATIISPLVSAGVAIWAILVAKKTISESRTHNFRKATAQIVDRSETLCMINMFGTWLG